MTTPTRKAASEALSAMGVNGAAAELLLQDGARGRHLARVAAARAVLLSKDHMFADAIVVGVAEIIGVGGPLGLAGAGTARHPGLDSLGTGRKHARDGGAWDAAIAAAIYELMAELRKEEPTGFDAPFALLATAQGLQLTLEGANMPWAVDLATIDPRWLRSLAAEGLRRATGSDPVHLHELPVQFAGEPSAWAEVFNSAGLDHALGCSFSAGATSV